MWESTLKKSSSCSHSQRLVAALTVGPPLPSYGQMEPRVPTLTAYGCNARGWGLSTPLHAFIQSSHLASGQLAGQSYENDS